MTAFSYLSELQLARLPSAIQQITEHDDARQHGMDLSTRRNVWKCNVKKRRGRPVVGCYDPSELLPRFYRVTGMNNRLAVEGLGTRRIEHVMVTFAGITSFKRKYSQHKK